MTCWGVEDEELAGQLVPFKRRVGTPPTVTAVPEYTVPDAVRFPVSAMFGTVSICAPDAYKFGRRRRILVIIRPNDAPRCCCSFKRSLTVLVGITEMAGRDHGDLGQVIPPKKRVAIWFMR